MKIQNVDLKNKTILVTGAAGFIGSNLVLELLRTTEPVHIVGMYIPFQVNHLHDQTEPVSRRMRATLTETEPVLFDANYQATVC